MSILTTIESLGLVKVQNAKSTYGNHYVQFLDYVLIKPGIDFGNNPQTGIDKEDLINNGSIVLHLEDPEMDVPAEDSIFHGGIESMLNSQTYSRMSLVLNKVIVEFQSEDVKVQPGEDSEMVVINHLMKLIFLKIQELARTNKNDIEKSDNLSLDYTEVEGADVRRRLMSKLMSMSSLIATRGRRGPGTYVIAKREYIDLISATSSTAAFLYPLENDTTFGGLKLFVCNDLGNEIIVGRYESKSDSPGLQFISNDDSLEKNIFFNETDIAGINIRYSLASVSPNDKHNYISFNFNRTVFKTN